MRQTVTTRRIAAASLVGTAIEFYDFYIYGTAAALVFGPVFFPQESDAAQLLLSFATFAIAFIARPVGSALLGHFGDRVGRKATLVASLLLMGISTTLIGVLPGYAAIGWLAPALLCLLRFGQGLGLGGEWGGAALLAVENAPPGKRGWFGMFPQLGAPIGFICSAASFLALDAFLTDEQFFSFGWRIPFVASALLVFVGLYVRLKIHETPAFQKALDSQERVRVPMLTVLKDHTGTLVLGTLGAMATFTIFYLMTVFALSWGTSELHFTRGDFLPLQMLGMVVFALTIPLAAKIADRVGRDVALIAATAAIFLFGFAFEPLFTEGHVMLVTLFLAIGLGLMGCTYGPLGAALAELFPTAVRYTGASLTFNLAGILGASPAPYVATYLAKNYGLASVGWYLSAMAAITGVALIAVARRSRRGAAALAAEAAPLAR